MEKTPGVFHKATLCINFIATFDRCYSKELIVSLRKHRHELEIILRENEIDIIGLSETRLDSTVTDPMVSIEEYRMFCNDRDANGGGVAMYVRNSLPEPRIKIKSTVC